MSRLLPTVCVLALGILLYRCDEMPLSPDEIPAPSNSDFTFSQQTLFFKGVRFSVKPPCQIQFLFSLRDSNNRAVNMHPADLAARTRIFENEIELDYTETNFFVSAARNFRMDVVLVLDFTNSMAATINQNTSAIDQMLAGSKSIIRALGPAHRIALVEFHDRNVEPQVLVYFTSDTSYIMAALGAFASLPIDHGSSRIWDAIYKGLSLFPTANNPDDVRILIFLSDGFDTSSQRSIQEVIGLARERDVQIHAVGTGSVHYQENLVKIAEATDGLYYQAENLSDLHTQFRTIAENLSGQYKLSYISLQQQGKPRVTVEVDYLDAVNSFSRIIDLSGFTSSDKDDRIGRVSYSGTVVADQGATAFIGLEHTPRNIDRFRFRVGPAPLKQVEIIPPAEGGLLDSTWSLSASNDGWFEATSARNVLPFGAFGWLFRLRLEPISGSGIDVPFAMDNTIYTGGKRFIYPDTLRLGLEIENVAPANKSAGTSRQPTLRWRISDPITDSLTYDVHLDTVPLATTVVASGLSSTSFQPPQLLAPGTTYYWKIVVHTAENHFTSSIWQFTTTAQ